MLKRMCYFDAYEIVKMATALAMINRPEHNTPRFVFQNLISEEKKQFDD